jgi:flagellar hook-length control protein FliK
MTFTAKMVLKPESLGTVFVNITLNKNVINLDLKTDTKEAMKAIENQLASLKDNFKNLGVEVNKINISMTTDDENQYYNLTNNSTSDEKNNQKSKREFVESLRMLNNLNIINFNQENNT